MLRINLVHNILIIGQHGGAVGTDTGQVGTGPVKYGHKIVADDMDIVLRQVLQCGNVVGDMLFSLLRADLDVVGYIHRLDGGDLQAGVLHHLLKLCDLLIGPHLSRLLAKQGGNHPVNSGNLPDLLQGNAVVARSIPTQCHLHNPVLLKLTC